ncbi:Fatty acid cis/trans isomerase (CTI) [Nitrosomonas ureae]|uniref:Fatty acid cis/trans isomerase (CTI) n=1 Tax=Nitrosomonas ureae TaxID=44577 RepID=A0A285BUF0_9PROT|nr:fatty acid cis/trans isomerase [Nitrosomonas ureae]SNX58839.1 Fatty acid cis/trans isomerase (CTI) [Nitrosomonas ureae]
MINDSFKQTTNQGFFDQFIIWGLFMRMFRPCMYFVSLFFLLSACQINNTLFPSIAPAPIPIALPAPAENPVSYAEEIRPILEKKCLTCHSCYDAPCQLNLEGAEGLARGAFRESIYGGARTEAMQPTRLGLDEQTISGWRERGFYSVLHAENKQSEALISGMISLAKQFPFPENSKLPDSIELGINRKNQCVSSEKFADYAHEYPLSGMPFAVTGLSDQEYSLLAGWVGQGAVIPDEPITLTSDEKKVIKEWETFFNRNENRHKLVARWLFEHLFVASLYFPELKGEPRFFEILRSSTPSGTDIEPIVTVNPNDDPMGPFFYRLRPITGSIVHKRRIPYPLHQEKQQRINALFFNKPWQIRNLPGYSYAERANPFVTFADIPAYARYQFMLDDAEYFVRTFIHGPVCRGQIATDVIRDHFWTLFQDPESDLFVTDAAYQREAIPLLAMPGQNDDLLAMGENWLHYLKRHNDYQALRQNRYVSQQPQGASLAHVWDGAGKNKNALLTIFRHHNSASVVGGLVGGIPQTLWLMDYPLLERTYYELVVNFDVFGNVAHQLLTRLYFDLIRNGSEHNFMRLMPAGQREAILHNWYQDLGKLKFGIVYEKIDDESPSAEIFTTKNPKQELAHRILARFQSVNAMSSDPLNRCQNANCSRSSEPRWVQNADAALSTLAARPAAGLSGIKQLPEVTFIRVTNEKNERTVYTLLRDRAHSNVAFILGEESRYQPEKDQLTIYPGITGSYPNYIFDVPVAQIGEFVTLLGNAEKMEHFEYIVETWGIRRTHPQFWEILHDFTAWQSERQPLIAGIFDINRYENF